MRAPAARRPPVLRGRGGGWRQGRAGPARAVEAPPRGFAAAGRAPAAGSRLSRWGFKGGPVLGRHGPSRGGQQQKGREKKTKTPDPHPSIPVTGQIFSTGTTFPFVRDCKQPLRRFETSKRPAGRSHFPRIAERARHSPARLGPARPRRLRRAPAPGPGARSWPGCKGWGRAGREQNAWGGGVKNSNCANYCG